MTESRHLRDRTAEQRLRDRLVEQTNGCLTWPGAHTPWGYGRIRVDGSLVMTHRFAWELVNGPIPEGLLVLHHCDNPPCCQTDPTDGYPEGHLFLGTHADNGRDSTRKGRRDWQRRTTCPRGHPLRRKPGSTNERYCPTCQVDANRRWRERKRAT